MKAIEAISQRATVGRNFADIVARLIDVAEQTQAEEAIHSDADSWEWQAVNSLLKSAGSKVEPGPSVNKMRAMLERQTHDVLSKLRLLVDISRDIEFDTNLYGADRVQSMIDYLCSKEVTAELPAHLLRGLYIAKQQGINIEKNWL
jgi:hypothetical protein